SDVNSGTVGTLFTVSGSGTIGAIRWNYYLPKWGQLEQKLSLGLDYRAFKNDVAVVGGAGGLVPDITIHPLSLTYSGLRRLADGELSFYGSVSSNLSGGNDGDQAQFDLSRPGANANYSIFRAGMNYVQALPRDFQFRVAANGQYTTNALVSGEQFGLGGP